MAAFWAKILLILLVGGNNIVYIPYASKLIIVLNNFIIVNMLGGCSHVNSVEFLECKK